MKFFTYKMTKNLLFFIFASFFLMSLTARAQETTLSQEPTFHELQDKSNAGDIVAMRELGIAYAQGIIVPADFKQAAMWLEKAADAGDVDAMSKIGFLYERGDGVDQNLTTAIQWYQKAADNGDSIACYNLATIYEQGLGVMASNEKAFSWYKKGAELGDPESMRMLAAYYRNGKGTARDINKANEWEQKLKVAASDTDTETDDNTITEPTQDETVAPNSANSTESNQTE